MNEIVILPCGAESSVANSTEFETAATKHAPGGEFLLSAR
jgi:hypothetical protein